VTGWTLVVYLTGMVTAGFLACGLFFARFWWRSRDFLFAAFAGAFWLLAASTVLLVALPPPSEERTWFYLLRVVAYLLIAVAIVRKNTGGAGED
jgi:Family of unknown function (DUF5985)